jgi:D-amino-acid dehydrogenase
MKDKHVIVIGAGIIGLSSAYYLNKKGFKVTILDNTDGTDNCSFGNAGFFSPSHIIPLASPGIISQGLRWMMRSDSPFYIKPKLNSDLISWGLKFRKASNKAQVAKAAPILSELLMDSRKLIEQILEDESIDAGLNDKGLLMYCKSQQVLDEEIEMAEMAQRFGQDTEVLTAEEARALNPELEIDIVGAVLFKNDAFVTPHLLIGGLKKVLTAKGVDIQFGKQVDKFNTDHEGSLSSVTANGEEYKADEFVLATGSWSRDMMKQLDVKLPMQGGKGYSFVLPNPTVMPETCSILTEARVAVTPMKHGLRFAGTMEVNGLDLSINPKRVQGIVDSVSKYFPQFTKEDFKDIKPWAGLRPCSPDGMPYIGRPKKYSNLLVATGHAMLGISLGPVTGNIIAQLAVGEKPKTDLALMDVDRYNN